MLNLDQFSPRRRRSETRGRQSVPQVVPSVKEGSRSSSRIKKQGLETPSPNPEPALCRVCHKPATSDCIRTPKMCVTCCVYKQSADSIVCTAPTHLVHVALSSTNHNGGTKQSVIVNSDDIQKNGSEQPPQPNIPRVLDLSRAAPKIEISYWTYSKLGKDNVPVSSWLKEVKNTQGLIGFTDKQLVSMAINRIKTAEVREDIQDWMTLNESRLTWELFRKEMTARYSQRVSYTDIIYELAQCKQSQSYGVFESIDTHATRFATICKKCDDEDFTEHMKVRTYLSVIKGTIKSKVEDQIWDSTTRKFKSQQTLTGVITLCQLAEMNEKRQEADLNGGREQQQYSKRGRGSNWRGQTRYPYPNQFNQWQPLSYAQQAQSIPTTPTVMNITYPTAPDGSSVNPAPTPPSASVNAVATTPTTSVPSNVQSTQPLMTYYTGIQCFTCGQPGHLARYCPVGPQQPSRFSNNNNNGSHRGRGGYARRGRRL